MVFDVSWGEMIVLGAVGFYCIDRKDLPKACKMVGTQIGRIVGLVQGAQVRANRYAMNNEMKALQKELRSGLRELDAVKGELAMAASVSSTGLMGRGLVSNVSGFNATRPGSSVQNNLNNITQSNNNNTSSTSTGSGIPTNSQFASNYLAAATEASDSGMALPAKPIESLASRAHSVAAVAEEEWQKQGIGFVSQAELGVHGRKATIDDITYSQNDISSPVGGGSFLLSDIIQQSLIHDQYDRAMKEQHDLLMAKAENVKDNIKK